MDIAGEALPQVADLRFMDIFVDHLNSLDSVLKESARATLQIRVLKHFATIAKCSIEARDKLIDAYAFLPIISFLETSTNAPLLLACLGVLSGLVYGDCPPDLAKSLPTALNAVLQIDDSNCRSIALGIIMTLSLNYSVEISTPDIVCTLANLIDPSTHEAVLARLWTLLDTSS